MLGHNMRSCWSQLTARAWCPRTSTSVLRYIVAVVFALNDVVLFTGGGVMCGITVTLFESTYTSTGRYDDEDGVMISLPVLSIPVMMKMSVPVHNAMGLEMCQCQGRCQSSSTAWCPLRPALALAQLEAHGRVLLQVVHPLVSKAQRKLRLHVNSDWRLCQWGAEEEMESQGH